MKRLFTYLFFCISICGSLPVFAVGHWQEVDVTLLPAATRPVHATKYRAFTTDEAALKAQLFNLSRIPAEGTIIDLPLPDGTTMSFRVWQTPVLTPRLAAKYPGLKTFTGEAVNDRSITAKLDFNSFGFHAVIFNGGNESFIDPYGNNLSGYYIAHYKKDETREWYETMKCGVSAEENKRSNEKTAPQAKTGNISANGYTFRSYRLALACDHDYAQAATGFITPTTAQTLSAILTDLNRINGVYEREFSLSMTLVDNEDTIIWTQAIDPINGPDPFIGIDSNAVQCLTVNQTICDARIGDANYDLGHVFTTGAGGYSQVGVTCRSGTKAMSVTGLADPVGDGFTIDYVSHEMGHEYGAYHPFNSNAGNCGGGNLFSCCSYEPGSGSTIMAYAGICAPDDLQPHSDPYFHSVSLEEIQSYITTDGDVCAVKSNTNNKLVSIASFGASYTIPYLTPFELTAPAATDSVGDTSITYCWEEWNLGSAEGETLINTHAVGPIFRSYLPVKTTTRIFPEKSMVLAGVLSNAGVEDAEGEKVPDVARFLTFQLSVRDIYQGNGCFIIPNDTVHLDVVNTGTGFAVTSQNTPGTYYIGNTPATVTWNVAGTNTSPINTENVDIYLSVDGGNNWQYHIGTFPNTGSAIITMANPDTDVLTARIKVKGSNNVFFNVNSSDFTVAHSLESDTSILVCPVPTHSILRMSAGTKGILNALICNAVGQEIWKGEIDGETDISVAEWARGLYFVKLIDPKNQVTIRKAVVN